MSPTPPTGPENPDEQPTQRLDDLWVPGTASSTGDAGHARDTVDSTDPQERDATARSPWAARGLVVAGAVVALVAAGAFGAALARGGDDPVESISGFASSGSTSDEEGTDEDGDGSVGERLRDWAEKRGGGPLLRHGMGGKGFLGGMMGGPLLGPPLHGSYVVEDPDGGYRTLLSQHGEVTSVSSTSLTVRSDDGFTATYRLTDDTAVLAGPDGADDVENGAEVAVSAVRDGGSPRALHVVDLSQMQDRLREHLDDLRDLDLDDLDGDESSPSPSATTGSTGYSA